METADLRVLVVTNIYPTPKRPYVSPFVKEQVESLRCGFADLEVDVRVIEGKRPRLGYLIEIPLLPIIVKTHRYDLVHVHFGLTLVSTVFVRVPVVVTFHGTDLLENPTKYISRLFGTRAAKAIVVSEKLKKTLGYGEVIPCGIEVNDFRYPMERLNGPNLRRKGTIRVLFPANPLRKVKDYGLFHSVCEEIKRRGQDVEEVLLADVPREKVRELYWDCDILVLTSLSEGSPTVIKEAIAAKLPFVSVDVGDVEQWASMVDFGLVVSGRDKVNLADAVLSVLARVSHRSLLDNSKCLEEMSLENIARRVRKVYDEVIDQRRRA